MENKNEVYEVLKLYAVFDRVAGVYGEPFVAKRDELAVRRFNYVMANARMVCDDCELYLIGYYTPDLGQLGMTSSGKAEFICKYQGGVNET
ncbi:nonstructural protein [Dipodfec virus UOA04_Rod_1098]|nr:nonstructural protein [Dipodfec virus UOA04_Rod_1098]